MESFDSLNESVQFFELVCHDVRQVAEAKRHQLQEKYSDDTLKSMLSGVKWDEARNRTTELEALDREIVQQLASILSRKLTIFTVERIDALLTPVIEALRDNVERDESKQTASTQTSQDTTLPAAETASATQTALDSLKKEVKQIKEKSSRSKTPREKIREQRLKFIKPRIEKDYTWQRIADEYRQKYPKDETANPASLRRAWSRRPEEYR